MISNSEYSNLNNVLGAPDNNVATFTRNGGGTDNAYVWCNPTTNNIATSSASIIDVKFHVLGYFNSSSSYRALLLDIHSSLGCTGDTSSYSAGTTLKDMTYTFTPQNCSALTPQFLFNQPTNDPAGGHLYYFYFSSLNGASSGAVDSMWIEVEYAPTPPKPLIFIPGIMGSEFVVNQTFTPNISDCLGQTYSYNQGDTVWEKIDQTNVLSYITCGKYLDVLKLQADGQTPLYSQIVVKGTPVSQYDDGTTNSMLPYLVQHGYTTNVNLFVFTYDWRKDLAGNMTALDNLIATVSGGTTKVNIIAHSMGGMVARDYISDSTRAQKVNTLVELGTPHAGAPQALADLLYPTCIHWIFDKNIGSNHLQFICAINQNETYSLVQNFPGLFELLPSKIYYNTLYPDIYPYSDQLDIDHNGVTGALNFDQTRTLLANLGKNTTASRSADLFHDSLDPTYSNTNGVTTYLIAGSGIPTVGQLFDYVGSNNVIKHDAIPTDGDGTVPAKSATLNHTSNVYFAKEDHGSLAESGPALATAVNLLDGQTGLLYGVQTTPFSYNGQIISVHSPTQLDAYDSLSNHTGKNSDGSYEQTIPGSEYFELGDAKFIYLPSGGTYNITTKATAVGSFDLKVKDYTNSAITKDTLFLGVNQTASTTASMNLATTSAVLTVDVNGNGTNIQQVSPSYTLTGTNATDYAPPVTMATLSPTPNSDGTYTNPVTVTLSASPSAGFSVTNTYYTLDGGAQQTYSAPFTVTGYTSHTITYWSVDNAGLTEAQNSKTFTIASSSGITLRAASSGNNGSGSSSLTVNKPTGTASDDVMIAHVIVRTAGNTITAPSGWTLIKRQDSGSSISTATYWKLAGSSEPSSYTWSFSTSGEASGGIASYIGVNKTSPIDASNAQYNSGTSTVSNSGVTTTVPNDMLVFAVGITVPTTVNVPTGFTQEWSTTSTSSTTSEMSDKLFTSSGSTGTISGSHNGGSNSNITQLIALKSPPPPTSSLTEDWSSGSINSAKWYNWGGSQVSVVSNQLNITTTLSGTYYGAKSANLYNLTGSSVTNQVINAGNQSLTSFEAYVINVGKDGNNQFDWHINGNNIKAKKKIAGVQTTLASAPYDSSVQKYFRIRENSGTLYWDYSTDGITWTNFTTLNPLPFDITSVYLEEMAGTWNTEASTTSAVFDNFNILP